MSDTQTQIGKLLTDSGERDAIHIAVAPVVCGEWALSAGIRIGFLADGRVGRIPQEVIGIVDPFLTETVYENDKFFMFLLPNTITSLRHQWTHPAFEQSAPLKVAAPSESESWLRCFADEVDAEYDDMMRVAASHCDENDLFGDYLQDGGKWEGQSTPEEFWTHFAAVTGKTPKHGPPGIFSCSC